MSWPIELDIMETLIEGGDEPVAYVAVVYRSRPDLDDAAAIDSARRYVLHHRKKDRLRVYSSAQDAREYLELKQLRTLLEEPWVWDIQSDRARALMLEATPEANRLWWHADDRDWCYPASWV